MESILTDEEDQYLRQYAKHLHVELGEDAYHTAVCDMLLRGGVGHVHNIVGFFRIVIKRSLYKVFRHEQSERKNIRAYINNDRIPMLKGFVPGDVPHMTCRKGHEWKEETTAYIGTQRTCRICKREREARVARVAREKRRTTEGVV